MRNRDCSISCRLRPLDGRVLCSVACTERSRSAPINVGHAHIPPGAVYIAWHTAVAVLPCLSDEPVIYCVHVSQSYTSHTRVCPHSLGCRTRRSRPLRPWHSPTLRGYLPLGDEHSHHTGCEGGRWQTAFISGLLALSPRALHVGESDAFTNMANNQSTASTIYDEEKQRLIKISRFNLSQRYT